MDMFCNSDNMAPSSFGETVIHKNRKAWPALVNRHEMGTHRPDPSFYGIHTTLLHPAFGMFMDDIDMTRVSELTRDDFAFTLEFCREMSAVYPSEDLRQDKALRLLRVYLEEDIHPRRPNPSNQSSSDGSIVACVTAPVVVLNLEIKNEIGHGGAEPIFEGLGYYLNFFRQEQWCFGKCVVPALLVTSVGAHLSVSFVAHAEQVVMDPATPLLPLLFLPHDRAMMESVARCLWAVKRCVKHLKQFYSELQHSTATDSIERFSFPYLNSVVVDGVADPVHIDYLSQVGKKLVFRALLELPTGAVEIIVKFTKQYCEAAHRVCYEFERGAPYLYHIGHLPGHWIAVVMEDIQETRLFCKDSDWPILSRLVNKLHEHNIVHGDLRLGNILISADRVCLIDFDWSGVVDEQKYPSFMNHADIIWPPGASDGLCLSKEHDLHFLELFRL